jgi:precorrin 3B synthase CobZ
LYPIPRTIQSLMDSASWDVIVVGSGNAGLSAAIAAAEQLRANNHPTSCRVLVLEKAPAEWVGGNTRFTAGAYRTVFSGLEDVFPLVDNVEKDDHPLGYVDHKGSKNAKQSTSSQDDDASRISSVPKTASRIDMEPYTNEDFLADLERVTSGRTDKDLARVLVSNSNSTTKWLFSHGIRFQLSFNRQAYCVDGRWRFWGGMVLCVKDGGKGLTAQQLAAVERLGVQIQYNSNVIELVQSSSSSSSVMGLKVQRADGTHEILSARGGIILCAGGFEADPTMRRQHLGEGWDRAYVRGTPYNTGSLLTVALSAGAKQAGNWDGCHATCWDANAPKDRGDQQLTNQFTKSGYPLGIMVNVHGARFVDEGLDLRNYTYARFGRAILQQPNGIAFQVWDADGAKWLRKEEYNKDVVERITADSIDQLADKLSSCGLEDVDSFKRTVDLYNQAVQAHRGENPTLKFDPTIKDGLSTHSTSQSLELDKTNWALPIITPQFLAVKVVCGITFTFGGLAVEPETAAVLSKDENAPMPGLFCAGEMLGGLFWGNYPGGSGLTAGAVFGRRAGTAAAIRAIAGM